MSFRLVLKSVTSMTLNGVIALTSPNRGVILPNSVAYVKVVEDTLILSAAEMWAKNIVFSDILFIAIFAGVTENECVTENQRQITYPQYLHIERPESLVSVLGIWVRKIPIDDYDHGAMLSIYYLRKLRLWRIANAKSRVDVGDRL